MHAQSWQSPADGALPIIFAFVIVGGREDLLGGVRDRGLERDVLVVDPSQRGLAGHGIVGGIVASTVARPRTVQSRNMTLYYVSAQCRETCVQNAHFSCGNSKTCGKPCPFAYTKHGISSEAPSVNVLQSSEGGGLNLRTQLCASHPPSSVHTANSNAVYFMLTATMRERYEGIGRQYGKSARRRNDFIYRGAGCGEIREHACYFLLSSFCVYIISCCGFALLYSDVHVRRRIYI